MPDTPLHHHVRSRVLGLLLDNVTWDRRAYRGHVQVDPMLTVGRISLTLKEPVGDVTAVLWQLQKAQQVTFRERKGPKGNVIDRIRVKADLALDPDKAFVSEVSTEAKEQRQVSSVAAEYPTATGALKRYDTTPCTNREFAKAWCVEHDSKWEMGDLYCEAEWARRNPAVFQPEPPAPAEPEPEPTTPVEIDRSQYPAIQSLLDVQRKRAVIEDVADRLMTAGLDNLAGPMLDALSEATDLEREVIVLVTRLGWLDG